MTHSDHSVTFTYCYYHLYYHYLNDGFGGKIDHVVKDKSKN